MNKFPISLEELVEPEVVPEKKAVEEPIDATLIPEDEPKKSNKETELVVYCKIGYFEGLKEAVKKEQQDQYEIRAEQSESGSKGCIRVRKTTDSDGIRFVQTNKIRTEDNNLSIAEEFNIDISEEFFNSFARIAPRKTVKERFIFLVKNVTVNVFGEETKTIEVPELKFEVDVFPKEDGTFHEWCKVDIEIDPLLKFLNESEEEKKVETFNLNIKINHLPFKPTDSFVGSEATDEQKVILDNFYENIFSTKQ